MPGWEAALIQTGFIGMGLGLALGLPAYLRRRWPGVFTPRLGAHDGRRLDLLVVVTVVGGFWLSWTAGSPIAIDHLAAREAGWRALNGVSGAWALITVASVAALRRPASPRAPRQFVAALAWVGSGSLFAWGGWRLAITLYLSATRPHDVTMPENLGVAALLHALALLSGATVARALARGAAGIHEPLGRDRA
ncbi:hypothetical protein [Catenulispora subtropica]|uniref:Uncharacterized protein n=1 Tax=Catenulispora subtropica TaxID=450798 RepID=A0ABP5DAY2_9ACTN